MGGYERFNPAAKAALVQARQEARRLGHLYVGSEHLLLGLLEGQGLAALVLRDFGVTLQKARDAVEFLAGAGEQQPGQAVELAPRAKQAIEHTIEEARALGHYFIGPRHLLLGLTRVDEGMLKQTLDILGVQLEPIRRHLLHVLYQESDLAQQGLAAPAPDVASAAFGDQPAETAGGESSAWPVEIRDDSPARANGPGEPVPPGDQPAERAADEAAQPGSQQAEAQIAPEVFSWLAQAMQPAEAEAEQLWEDQLDERLTMPARRVFSLAAEEARRFRHSWIGAEHLLLALIRARDSSTSQIFELMGVTIKRARAVVAELSGPGLQGASLPDSDPQGVVYSAELDFNGEAKQALQYALQEAREANQPMIGPLYLARGLLRQGLGRLPEVLLKLDTNAEQLSRALKQRRYINPTPAGRTPPLPPLRLMDEVDATIRRVFKYILAETIAYFSDEAEAAIRLAGEEARQRQRAALYPEDLLVGILRLEQSTAASLLNRLGVDLARASSAARRMHRYAPHLSQSGQVRLSPEVEKLVEYAAYESLIDKRRLPGPEYLLLGIVRLEEAAELSLFARMGVDPAIVRRDVMLALRLGPARSQASPAERAVEAQTDEVAEHEAPAERKQTVPALARLSKRARQALHLAEEEARRLHHRQVGSGHLLLGLLRENGEVCGQIFADLAIDLEQARKAVLFIAGHGRTPATPEHYPLSARAQAAIDQAYHEMRGRRQRYLKPEHILLGLACQPEGLACGILEVLNVRQEQLRERLIQALGSRSQ